MFVSADSDRSQQESHSSKVQQLHPSGGDGKCRPNHQTVGLAKGCLWVLLIMDRWLLTGGLGLGLFNNRSCSYRCAGRWSGVILQRPGLSWELYHQWALWLQDQSLGQQVTLFMGPALTLSLFYTNLPFNPLSPRHFLKPSFIVTNLLHRDPLPPSVT